MALLIVALIWFSSFLIVVLTSIRSISARGHQAPDVLAPELRDVVRVPDIVDGAVTWKLSVPKEQRVAIRAILAWDQVTGEYQGRLRLCANPECRRFLIDHSKANSARWCSMAVCGNRMKARRHYQRTHSERAL